MNEELEAQITAAAVKTYDVIPFVLVFFAIGDVVAMISDPSAVYAAWAVLCVLVAVWLPPRAS